MNRRQLATSMIVGGAALSLAQREARKPSVFAGGWASLERMDPSQAIEAGAGDAISTLRTSPEAPDLATACSGGDTADEVITEILDGRFAKPLIDIVAGTTVTWVNTSIVSHQVVFNGLAFDRSAMLHQDDTFSVTFAEAGEFDYFCGPHPWMVGTVSVGTGDA